MEGNSVLLSVGEGQGLIYELGTWVVTVLVKEMKRGGGE
jgi:hypothetical protein